MLDLVEPFRGDNRFVLGSRDHILDIILHNWFVLFVHSILPYLLLHSFFEWERFKLNNGAHSSYVPLVPIRLPAFTKCPPWCNMSLGIFESFPQPWGSHFGGRGLMRRRRINGIHRFSLAHLANHPNFLHLLLCPHGNILIEGDIMIQLYFSLTRHIDSISLRSFTVAHKTSFLPRCLNLLPFSFDTWKYTGLPKILKWETSWFLPVKTSTRVLESNAWWGHWFWTYIAVLAASPHRNFGSP